MNHKNMVVTRHWKMQACNPSSPVTDNRNLSCRSSPGTPSAFRTSHGNKCHSLIKIFSHTVIFFFWRNPQNDCSLSISIWSECWLVKHPWYGNMLTTLQDSATAKQLTSNEDQWNKTIPFTNYSQIRFYPAATLSSLHVSIRNLSLHREVYPLPFLA